MIEPIEDVRAMVETHINDRCCTDEERKEATQSILAVENEITSLRKDCEAMAERYEYDGGYGCNFCGEYSAEAFDNKPHSPDCLAMKYLVTVKAIRPR